MMQRFILENQGFIPRKLSNRAPKIKDLARLCQTRSGLDADNENAQWAESSAANPNRTYESGRR